VEFAARGWKIIRQQNRYLGAARNAASRAARGEYLLFMDDDDVAQSDEISVFMQVALHTGADILTCSMERFSGTEPPSVDQPPRNIQVFLGPAVAAGAFRNVFGPANALVRRSALHSLGGFSEDYGVGFEDWEFFARAALQGFHLESIPRRLFWYRMSPRGMSASTDPNAARLRVMQPYLQAAPAPLRDLLLYAHGTYHTWQCGAALPFSHTHPQTPQAFVDDYWQSASWRSTRIFRNIFSRFRGRPKEARPIVHTTAEAWEVVNRMQQSISWNITGPFRALRRLLRRHRWPLYAFVLVAAYFGRPLATPIYVRAGLTEFGYCQHCLRRARRLGRCKAPALWP
jgi:glycosyltransferase involved in cell wall biosynthesis